MTPKGFNDHFSPPGNRKVTILRGVFVRDGEHRPRSGTEKHPAKGHKPTQNQIGPGDGWFRVDIAATRRAKSTRGGPLANPALPCPALPSPA